MIVDQLIVSCAQLSTLTYPQNVVLAFFLKGSLNRVIFQDPSLRFANSTVAAKQAPLRGGQFFARSLIHDFNPGKEMSGVNCKV